MSDGSSTVYLHAPAPLKRDMEKLARLQQSLKPKRKGSQRWKDTQARIAKLHAHIANCRRDWLHKTTTMLAKNHRVIVIEDLQIPNMTASAKGTVEKPGTNVAQKAGLNRAILDQAWGELRRELEYKCRWYGSRLVVVRPQYTSQTCHRCGHIDARNRPAQERFCCIRCGYEAHADGNAAATILAAGQCGLCAAPDTNAQWRGGTKTAWSTRPATMTEATPSPLSEPLAETLWTANQESHRFIGGSSQHAAEYTTRPSELRPLR